MSPEWQIAIIILVLSCAASLAYRKRAYLAALFLRLLETQARAARDKAKARKERNHADDQPE